MGHDSMKNAANKGFQATAHKLSLCDRLRTLQSYTVLPVGRRLNPDVGTGIYMATARTMDPPQLRNEGHGRRGNDIGNEARNSR